MQYRLTADYLHYLKALDGNDFQEEIVKLYADSKNDFQSVRGAGGDGGCDGLFNGKTTNICCYGIDQKKGKQAKKGDQSKVKTKFADDLKRVLELESKGKGAAKTYFHHENAKIFGLLPTGKKIKVIHLVANYDDNGFIKHFSDVFEELKKHSQLRFVEADCEVIYIGLEGIKTYCNITESALTRLKYREIEESVQLAFSFDKNALPNPDATEINEFEDKFNYLEQTYGTDSTKITIIRDLKTKYFERWCRYISFMQNLQKKSPNIFAKATRENQKIISQLKLDFMGQDIAPIDKIAKVRSELHDKWLKIFDNQDSNQEENLIDMDTGNLIGTCPLEWRKGRNSA
jgi:hypothetical protein